MQIIEDIDEMRQAAADMAVRQVEAGLVSTKGALHRGHASIIERASDENEVTVVSVFVNPGEFDSESEYDNWPRTPEEDADLAESAGADILFRPPPEDFLSAHAQTTVHVHGLSRGLCGMSRGQGVFRAVTTATARMFNIVRPVRAYYGQKDVQEALVIQRMAIDLGFPVSIVLCPVVRDDDGLPLSARLERLSPDHRTRAAKLRIALLNAREMIRGGERASMALSEAMASEILSGNQDGELELEYIDVVSPSTLDDAQSVDGLVLLAGALRIGGVRVIDNLLCGPDGPWDEE